jgi:hypothetical protein
VDSQTYTVEMTLVPLTKCDIHSNNNNHNNNNSTNHSYDRIKRNKENKQYNFLERYMRSVRILTDSMSYMWFKDSATEQWIE